MCGRHVNRVPSSSHVSASRCTAEKPTFETDASRIQIHTPAKVACISNCSKNPPGRDSVLDMLRHSGSVVKGKHV